MNTEATENPEVIFSSALIVDDHPLFCDALSMTLKTVTEIQEIQTAENLEQALDHIAEHGSPDIVVLDLNLPDVNGLDGLIRLKIAAKVPVVVVSSMADNNVIGSTIQAGASGFIPKHSPREVFRAAFLALRANEVFVPNGYVNVTDNEAGSVSREDAVTRMATLTNQQGRILQLLCEGKLNKQIAYDLSIAETTVKAHVTAIMRKLGVQSRTQAVLIAKETSFSNVLQDSP